MEINFNEGKKELDKKEDNYEPMISEDGEVITDYEEIEEEQDDKPVKSVYDKDELKAQLKKPLMIGGAILIVIIIIMLLMSLFTKKQYTYGEIETIMENACKDYFSDYANYLPKEVNDSRNVSVENLVNGGYMKELEKYLPDGVACTGRVTVEKVTSGYDYNGYLNCGESYKTQELYKKITDDKNVVTSGYGLYTLNGNYVFRGENVNNYLKLGAITWRIVRVNSDGTIVLINSDKVKESSFPWDDRYNITRDYNVGINNYATSRLKENLKKLYDNKLLSEYKLLTSNDKAKLTAFDLCVGKRISKAQGNNGSYECSEKDSGQYIGALTVYEYMQASLDKTCKTSISATCQNYNYLNSETYTWWLATGDKANSYDVYCITPSVGIHVKHADTSGYLRPVVHLKSNVFYKSGNGSQEKPYTIK